MQEEIVGMNLPKFKKLSKKKKLLLAAGTLILVGVVAVTSKISTCSFYHFVI